MGKKDLEEKRNKSLKKGNANAEVVVNFTDKMLHVKKNAPCFVFWHKLNQLRDGNQSGLTSRIQTSEMEIKKSDQTVWRRAKTLSSITF